MHFDAALAAMLTTAALTGVIHTAAGPDHYLPFIAISKSRGYGWTKTAVWTLLCGIGHIGSALLLAAVFMLFSELITKSQMVELENWRGGAAAWTMIAMGAALLLHSARKRWKQRPRLHRHKMPGGGFTAHIHAPDAAHKPENLAYWVLFIVFVFGPCEALLPLLTAAAALGPGATFPVAAVFSTATIATMLTLVSAGRFGLKFIRFPALEKFAPELAAITIMACGLAIACLDL
ncbi:MAG: hypothetical protein PHI85_00540 [Victivallaceae bacterium]|nr:hypothetical protein [Victivallaceae bacterium]